VRPPCTEHASLAVGNRFQCRVRGCWPGVCASSWALSIDKVKTERRWERRSRKICRLLNARLGQVQDKGVIVSVREALAKFVRWGGEKGVAGLERKDEVAFDAAYGTDTRGIIQPWDLDIPDGCLGQAVQYDTASVDVVNTLLACLAIDYRDYTFVDLGSGKGRALLLASRFPFRQIIGVELSSELHQAASVNIRRFRAAWQRCSNILAICENATTFTFPPENTVLYLFNPFGAQTLRVVVAHLLLSLTSAPRRVYIIYVKPSHKGVLEQSGMFSLCHSIGDNVVYVNDAVTRRV